MPRLQEFLDGVAVLDNAGRVVTKFTPFATGDVGRLASPVDTQKAAPTGTSSATMVMAGCRNVITPGKTGIVIAYFSYTCATSGNTDGGKVQIAYGTATPPANGDALIGTVTGAVQNFLATTAASAKSPGAIQAKVTGLTLGVAYWFDLQFAAVTGGTFTLTNVNASLQEIGN